VYVYYSDNTAQPNVDGTDIWPLGPYAQQDRLYLSEVFSQDELSVMNNGDAGATISKDKANQDKNKKNENVGLNGQVFVNVSIPGFTV
jgi:hypothetical protein